VKFRVPGVVIGGCPEWSASEGYLRSGGLCVSRSRRPSPLPAIFVRSRDSPTVFYRSVRQWGDKVLSGQGVGLAGSFCHCRQVLWQLFRPPPAFSTGRVSPEFPQTTFSGAESAVLSFSGVVVSGQARIRDFFV